MCSPSWAAARARTWETSGAARPPRASDQGPPSSSGMRLPTRGAHARVAGTQRDKHVRGLGWPRNECMIRRPTSGWVSLRMHGGVRSKNAANPSTHAVLGLGTVQPLLCMQPVWARYVRGAQAV